MYFIKAETPVHLLVFSPYKFWMYIVALTSTFEGSLLSLWGQDVIYKIVHLYRALHITEPAEDKLMDEMSETEGTYKV